MYRRRTQQNLGPVQCESCRGNPVDSGIKSANGKAFKYQASKPNEKWVSNITYIDVDSEWMQLTVMMDLYSRQIIGWAFDETMTTELILEAFNIAVAYHQVKPGLRLHADLGAQDRPGEYHQALKANKIRPSMSRKDNCWGNAVMESFFSLLKIELISADNYKTTDEAYRG